MAHNVRVYMKMLAGRMKSIMPQNLWARFPWCPKISMCDVWLSLCDKTFNRPIPIAISQDFFSEIWLLEAFLEDLINGLLVIWSELAEGWGKRVGIGEACSKALISFYLTGMHRQHIPKQQRRWVTNQQNVGNFSGWNSACISPKLWKAAIICERCSGICILFSKSSWNSSIKMRSWFCAHANW